MSLPRERKRKSTSNGSDQILSGRAQDQERPEAKWERTGSEWKRKTQSKPGQTGPRLAEVASGPQTINKERSNLWTGSLISTLLLFSHLIDGLQCRFVLPPLLLIQQLLFFPAFLRSFLSFSREINTHGWTGTATGESQRLDDELRDGTFGWVKNCRTRNIIALPPPMAQLYIDNNFGLGSLTRHCIRKYVYAVLIMPIHILQNAILSYLSLAAYE